MEQKEIKYRTCKSETKNGRPCLAAVAFDGYCFAHWSKLKYKDKK